MPADNFSEVVITKRLIRIGYQTFPIRNIARIQKLHFETSLGRSSINSFMLFLFGGSALLGIALFGSGNGSKAGQLGLAVLIISIIAFIIALAVGSSNSRHDYVLVIETSGGHSTALTSPQSDTVYRLEYALLSAIENPPESEQRVLIGNSFSINNHYDFRAAKGFQVGGSGNIQNTFNG